jgi:Protein of unknown function (DUF2380)
MEIRSPRWRFKLFLCNGRKQSAPLNALRAGVPFAVGIALSALPPPISNAMEQPTPLAIIDFNYQDTSGESADQSALHQARLTGFMRSLRADLAGNGRFVLVVLSCQPDPCSITQTPPEKILDAARHAGARLLLFGGIHKESTLIQWAKVQAVDVKADKPVFDRLFTFRGDTDEAWQRAEAFIVAQLNALDISK